MANSMSQYRQNGVDYIIDDPTVAPVFVESAAYAAGQYVKHQGNLYLFTADHAAGAWNASEVTQAILGNEVSDLKSALNNNVSSLVKSIGYIEETVSYSVGTAHDSRKDILYINIPQGNNFVIDFYSSSSILVKFYAFYTDGTRENIYQKTGATGSNTTGTLTAAKEITSIGAFIDDAVSDGTLKFSITSNDIKSNIEGIYQTLQNESSKSNQQYDYHSRIEKILGMTNTNLIPADINEWKNGAYNNSSAYIISPKNPVHISLFRTTTFYAYWSGVDLTRYPNIVMKIYGFNSSDERIINTTLLDSSHSTRWFNLDSSCSYFYIAINTNNGQDVLPPSFIYDNGIRLYLGTERITTDNQYDALYNKQYQYGYQGDKINLRKRNGYNVLDITNGSVGSTSTVGVAQACDIYDGKIFQLHQNGYIRIIDIATGEIIGTTNQVGFGHGNCCQFAKTKEFTDDISPVLYVSSWGSPYSIYAIRIKDLSTAEVIRTYRAGVIGQTGSHINYVVDFDTMTAYAVSYYTDSTSSETNNYMIIAKYNMNVQISGDGIYWMEHDTSYNFNLQFFPVMQDNKFIDNKILILSSPGTSGTETKIYVIDVIKKAITNVMSEFPTALVETEAEGLAIYDDGESENYTLIVRDAGYKTYKIIFG